MEYRTCTKCGKEFEATTEFFYKKDNFELRTDCKTCCKKRNKKWRDENVEYNKKYYIENAEYIKNREKQYYIDNAEHKKQYRIDNAEHKKQYNKKYYIKNIKHIKKQQKQYHKQYRIENKDKINAYRSKRRARKLNQTPPDVNSAKIQLYYTICAYLNKGLEIPAWHVDHIQPISKGGLHHEDNLQILTATLNLEKHDKWPLTMIEEIKYNGIKI